MYSGVTLGLIHGSAPHAYVLCHRAGSTEIEGAPGHPIPPLDALVRLHEEISLPARPARVAARRREHARPRRRRRPRAAIRQVAGVTGLPADDPVRFGPDRLLDAVLAALPAT